MSGLTYRDDAQKLLERAEAYMQDVYEDQHDLDERIAVELHVLLGSYVLWAAQTLVKGRVAESLDDRRYGELDLRGHLSSWEDMATEVVASSQGEDLDRLDDFEIEFDGETYDLAFEFENAVNFKLAELAGRQVNFGPDEGDVTVAMPLTDEESILAVVCDIEDGELYQIFGRLLFDGTDEMVHDYGPVLEYGSARQIFLGRPPLGNLPDPYLIFDRWVLAVDSFGQGGEFLLPWFYARWAWDVCQDYARVGNTAPLAEARKLWPDGPCEAEKKVR